MSVLIVEDSLSRCRWFKEQFIGYRLDITCDVREAIELLKKNSYEYIFLDHDLKEEHYSTWDIRDDENTGYGVAKWLADNMAHREAQIIIHSLNPSGSQRMLLTLESTGHNVRKVPYLDLQKRMIVRAR